MDIPPDLVAAKDAVELGLLSLPGDILGVPICIIVLRNVDDQQCRAGARHLRGVGVRKG